MNGLGIFLISGLLLCQTATCRRLFDHDFYSHLNLSWLFDSKRHRQESDMPKFCLTDACRKLAQSVLDGLDSEVDPCEDFYSFACGNWIRNHPVPPTENHWNQFEILEKRLDVQVRELLEEENLEEDPQIVKTVRKVYKACMNTGRIERRGLNPLVKLLEEFDNWPLATSDWDPKRFNWQRLISDVGRRLAINTILMVYVDVDKKNTSRNVVIVDEPTLALPRYLLTFSESGYVEPYITFISESARLVARARGDVIYPFNMYTQSFNLIKFEIELAKIMRKEEDKRNANDLYDLVTVKELQEWTDRRILYHPSSKIDWKSLITSQLGLSLASGETEGDITGDTPVVVTHWAFLENLMNLIDKTSPRVLANYILWRVVNKFSRDLNKQMTNLNFQFKKELSSVTEDYPRWYDCVMTSGYLSFAVGYMYVKRHFDDKSKTKAIEMVEDIRSAFKDELAEVPWMDAETKKEAMEKADFMNHFIGYPNWYENITFLEEYYKGVEICDEHFENKVALRGFLSRKLSASLQVGTNRDEWIASPAIANAFYNPQLNSIIFPAGVLQDPFFNKDQPEALNYGSIGAVVGHEITHGFDDLGRQSDKLGNIKEWWSKETKKTYLENALCFVNQYENYRIPELDAVLNTKVTMNGVLTLSENIADNGGLRAALRAYQTHKERTGGSRLVLPGLEHFTQEQLFYIGFARVWCESPTEASLLAEVLGDSHSPHRLRVIGSVSNSEHFASTWRCNSGTNMNPQTKCKLW
ncbi:hypothetical protein RUM43_000252 [Polyplax serrata]|uniref:Uncharacterized protein n=1 Tax=Polyplax serrata TaxID=468196 RepID=A0AAN8SFE2_POLSC